MNVDLGTNDRTPRFMPRFLAAAAVLMLAAQPLRAAEEEAGGDWTDPPIVGEVIEFDDPIQILVPPGSDPSVPVWTGDFLVEGAPWVGVHFTILELPQEPGEPETRGRLVFQNPTGEPFTPYWGNGPERLTNEDGMWTDFFWVEGLTLTLYGDPFEPVTIVIDRWAYGIEDVQPLVDDPDDACLKDVKCLEDTDTRYKKATAVARLWIETERLTFKHCTGFLYVCPDKEEDAPKNLLMTAKHCFEPSWRAFKAEFMAERAECKDPVDKQKKCPGKEFANKNDTVSIHKCCDIASLELKGSPADTYGALELKSEKDLKKGESVLFVPQHPQQHCKEYSEGKYTGFVALDFSDCLHNSKTGGNKGSSGAPMIDTSDWKVVGILAGGPDPDRCVSKFSAASKAIAAFCASEESEATPPGRSGQCELCVRPDQLHIVGPVPNELSVGEEGTITATVQANFCGIPGMEVVFTTLAGELTYTDGYISEDGSEAILYTPEEGQVEMPFIADGPGPALIEVAVTSGNELSTFFFFEILGAPLVAGGDDLQTDPPSSNEDDQAGADVLDDLLFGDPSTLNDDADPTQDRPDDPSATDDGVDLPDADGRTTSSPVPQGTCGALGLITMSAMCGALPVLRGARRRRSL